MRNSPPISSEGFTTEPSASLKPGATVPDGAGSGAALVEQPTSNVRESAAEVV
jgi:hypothetical protein